MHRAIRKSLQPLLATVLLGSVAAFAGGEIGRYQTHSEFLLDALGTETPASGVIWINDELRDAVTQVLGHPPGMLRIRYWYEGESTAWILDEIGKEQPITFGIVVENTAIERLRVLQFRESRGWEIRYPFFTRQFSQVRLDDGGSLSRGIDGISGATLSVKAATRSARLALVLDEHARQNQKHAANTTQ